jgi:biopolymer transport protein ExbD
MQTDDKKDMKKQGRTAGAFAPMKRANKSLGRVIEAMELDVTSVMNLFMVIIPFLLSMAVFTQVSVIEFSLPPAQTEGASNAETKELDISIVISIPSNTSPGGFRIVGTGKKLDLIPLDRGKYQFDILQTLLKEVKFQYPSQKGVVLVIDGNVLYDDIIHFMDICRESQFPEIGLSGEIG